MSSGNYQYGVSSDNLTWPAYLHDLESLDLASVLNVRASAEIDKGSATVDGAAFTSDELINVVQLIFAVSEHLLEVLLGHLQIGRSFASP